MRGVIGVLAVVAALSGCQSGVTGPSTTERAALEASYPFGTHRDCDAEVALALQSAGVVPASVDNIWYQDEEILDAGDEDRLVGYTAYARLVDQPGLVVVDLTKFCLVRQVYTRDGLVLPGLPAF